MKAESISNDFSFEKVTVPERILEGSGRELSAKYYDKIVTSIILHYGKRLIIPVSIRRIWESIKTVKYIIRGLKTLRNGRLQVELLDAIAITAAMLTGVITVCLKAKSKAASAR